MAFVTYILLAALQSGLQSRFHPEIFGVVATKAIVVLILDFLFVKGGCYLLGIQGTNPIVDLLAYGGYKFVGCVITLANSSTKLTTLQRDRNAYGWTGWIFADALFDRVCLHFLSKRVFPRAYPVCILSVPSHTCPSSVHCVLWFCPMLVRHPELLALFLTHNVRGASPFSSSSLLCRSYSWVYWSVYNPRIAYSDVFPFD
jgi:YIF1